MVKTTRKKYACTVCNKLFNRSGNLSAHMRIHTGVKPFKCDVCGKAFTMPGHLTNHQRIHTGEKPFVCPFPACGRAFSQSGNLSSHIRTHTGERPYKCTFPGCTKAFKLAGELGKHVRTHLENDTASDYVCGVNDCKEKFTDTASLTRHWAAAHATPEHTEDESERNMKGDSHSHTNSAVGDEDDHDGQHDAERSESGSMSAPSSSSATRPGVMAASGVESAASSKRKSAHALSSGPSSEKPGKVVGNGQHHADIVEPKPKARVHMGISPVRPDMMALARGERPRGSLPAMSRSYEADQGFFYPDRGGRGTPTGPEPPGYYSGAPVDSSRRHTMGPPGASGMYAPASWADDHRRPPLPPGPDSQQARRPPWSTGAGDSRSIPIGPSVHNDAAYRGPVKLSDGAPSPMMQSASYSPETNRDGYPYSFPPDYGPRHPGPVPTGGGRRGSFDHSWGERPGPRSGPYDRPGPEAGPGEGFRYGRAPPVPAGEPFPPPAAEHGYGMDPGPRRPASFMPPPPGGSASGPWSTRLSHSTANMIDRDHYRSSDGHGMSSAGVPPAAPYHHMHRGAGMAAPYRTVSSSEVGSEESSLGGVGFIGSPHGPESFHSPVVRHAGAVAATRTMSSASMTQAPAAEHWRHHQGHGAPPDSSPPPQQSPTLAPAPWQDRR